MDVTIALVLGGPAAAARAALHALKAMNVPSGVVAEILIAGPSDKGMSNQLGPRLPVRFVHSLNGSSGATQRLVLDQARGTHIMWIGEDVEAEAGWLKAYVDSFDRHPEASVFAGKIVPQLSSPTPSWFEEAQALLQFPLGVRDFGPFCLPLFALEGRVPFAANYAIRREAAVRLLGEHEQSAEDDPDLLAVITPAIDRGFTGYWVPDAVVRRPIDHAQQTTRAIYDYYHAAGRAAARMFERDTSPRVAGVPRWLLRRTAEGAARYRRDRIKAPPIGWVRSLIDYAADRGAVDHLRRLGATPR